jgi:hypothetical protein
MFDIDYSTSAQDINPEENDTTAMGDDISSEQGTDEPVEDNVEMGSGSTFLKHIPLFLTNIVYR